jgi:hypothetical protein
MTEASGACGIDTGSIYPIVGRASTPHFLAGRLHSKWHRAGLRETWNWSQVRFDASAFRQAVNIR